jgi:hypothetical protein
MIALPLIPKKRCKAGRDWAVLAGCGGGEYFVSLWKADQPVTRSDWKGWEYKG